MDYSPILDPNPHAGHPSHSGQLPPKTPLSPSNKHALRTSGTHTTCNQPSLTRPSLPVTSFHSGRPHITLLSVPPHTPHATLQPAPPPPRAHARSGPAHPPGPQPQPSSRHSESSTHAPQDVPRPAGVGPTRSGGHGDGGPNSERCKRL